MKLQFSLPIFTAIVFSISVRDALSQTYTPSNRTPVADGTMNTQVSGNGNNFNITGGVNKGQTLFHSFNDFSVPTNGAANFINSANPRDIITRVTGTNFSDINGLINSNGANFFLINPNGVTFGTGAQLNVGRAFMATSAEGINLVDGTGRTFSFGKSGAGDAPLLSVNSSVLFNPSQLVMGGSSGQINNFGTLQTNNTSQYIGLIGGNVTLNGGKIFAPGGRVDIGGLNSAGTVTITSDGLVYGGSNPTRGNVTLNNGAVVSVRATGTLEPVNTLFGNATAPGSTINISANNIDILNSGFKTSTEPAAIDAGLEENSGTYASAGGDINFNTTGKVTINNSYIKNTLRSGAAGNIGGINIKANGVEIKNDSLISTILSGRGDVGDITIASSGDINVSNGSFIASDNIQGFGNTGNIDIKSGGNVNVTDRSSISSDNFEGTGDSGNIDIKSGGNINVIGTNDISLLDGKPNPALSFISTDTSGKGNTGKITLDAQGDISFSNRSILSSTLQEKSEGDSRGIEIKNARDLNLNNTSRITTSNISGVGSAGDIKIKNIRNLTVANQSAISSDMNSENSRDNGGNIDIQARGNIKVVGFDLQSRLIPSNVPNFAIITSSTSGRGNAGKISIDTTGIIEIANEASISTVIEPTGQGNSGEIEIKNARNLKLVNTGYITSDNLGGQGNTGKITIDIVGDIDINNLSWISTGLAGTSQGNSQGIEIKNARNLTILNGSYIGSDTSSPQGNAGNIDIKTSGNIEIVGVDPPRLPIRDYPTSITGSPVISFVSTNSLKGAGQAANISISTYRLDLRNNAALATSGREVSGGDITLAISDLLLMRNNGRIFTNSFSAQSDSNGGNIAINSPLIVALSPSNFIAADALGGNGGRVNIASQGLFGIQYLPKGQTSPFFSSFITSSSTFGRDGAVTVDTPGIDPGRDTTELPNTTTDASNQISPACGASTRDNKFILAGRGGLPANADDPLTADVIWQDPRAASSQPAASNAPTNQLPPPAVGMVFDGKGKVTLVAAGIPAQQTGTNVACPQGKK